MKLTLCGSARFEKEFKKADKLLSLAGHVVYSLAVYPSDAEGKDWYTAIQKDVLDTVHKLKILNSEGIVLIAPNGYIGDSTRSELRFAKKNHKAIFTIEFITFDGGEFVLTRV